MNTAATPYLLYTGGPRPSALTAGEHAVAQLFDGQRGYAAVASAASALGETISAAQAEGLAARLSELGLLRRGRLQPQPVPAFTDDEAGRLGWFGGAMPAAGAVVLPPSSMPGSQASPGLLGGLIGSHRGKAPRIVVDAASPLALRLADRLLNWPLRSPAMLALLTVLLLFAGLGFWHSREAVVVDFAASFRHGYHLLTTLLSAYVVNIVSQYARAAAIARWTPQRPRIGWVFSFLGIPYLFADSAGAPERADRVTRLRIVGAVLTATAVLMLAAAFCWLLFHRGNPGPAELALIGVSVSMIALLLRINPLAAREGYQLLAQWLNAPDLRAQAQLALFGMRRAWMQPRAALTLRALRIYAVLSVLFVVLVFMLMLIYPGDWLSNRFGGVGALMFIAMMGSAVYQQLRKFFTPRSNLGRPVKPPFRMSRKRWIIAGVLLLIALFPYRYEPSGSFRVLPRDRADVRALVAGDVREVLVQEGADLKAGQVIARLADDAARSAEATSAAEVAQLSATLSSAKTGGRNEEVELARSRVATARKKFEVSNSQAQRLEAAYKRKSITAAEYDKVRGQADVDRQALIEAERGLDLVKIPALDDRISAIEAQLKAAEAVLSQRKAELEATRISAPIAGRLVSASLKFSRGNFLDRGEQLGTIEDTGELYAEILLPETGISDIELGAVASVKPWAFPGSSFDGEVTSIAPNAQDGTYGKVVRVLVRIKDPDAQLKPEMTGNAKVQGHRHPLILVYTRALRRFLFVEVWSWLP